MANPAPKIFLSAAEASGDLHAAGLIRALRKVMPDARFVGVAGPLMAAEGCQVLEDMTTRAAMLGGPLRHLGYYWRLLRRLRGTILEERFDAVVPVDSPAFNWHIAAAARQAGTPVIYYISPQVWAWAPWRVKKLARLTDAVACILPFEQRYLRDRGVHATYVGHPLLDSLPPRQDPLPDLLDAFASGTWRIALLPGSRAGEVRAHTPALLAVAAAILRRWPKSACTLAAYDQAGADIICREMAREGANRKNLEVVVNQTRDVMAASHLAVAASGTVTLELAHFGVPTIVFYNAGLPLSLMYRTIGRSRRLMPTPHLCLVNILAGHRLVPELMPCTNVTRLKNMTLEIMDDVGWLCQTRQELIALSDSLAHPSGRLAADNAAQLVMDVMKS